MAAEVKLMNTCAAAAAAAVIVAVIAMCLVKPLRGVLHFLLNFILGTAAMFVVNTAFPKIAVGINPFTAFASGVLGFPGTVMVYILKNLIC